MPTMADDRIGFRIEEVTIRSPSLPAGAEPLHLCHLSDLHVRTLGPRHRRLVELINERRPHFVFLTGDLISRRDESLALLGEVLSGIESRHGVYACRGNWEVHHAPRRAELKARMAEWGAHLLVNESVVVETASGVVRVSALDDLAAGWPDFEATLTQSDRADYTILLSHAPLAVRFVDERSGVDLVLSGHTHGGQIRIPLLWRLMQPICHGGFPDGLYRMDWGHLYVSRGFGTVGLPVRFLCPAEVAFLRVSRD